MNEMPAQIWARKIRLPDGSCLGEWTPYRIDGSESYTKRGSVFALEDENARLRAENERLERKLKEAELMKTLEEYKNSDSNLVRHAYRELEIIGGLEEESQSRMAAHILDIVERFADEGHSGFSASYALGIIKRVLAFEPCTPLTGEDDEWTEVIEGTFQNKRLYTVFKDGRDSEAYWIDGKVFSDDGGKTWFTSSDSRVPVTFPFLPGESERVIL